MRISSFLLGGIVGAAAVVYLSKNNKTMFTASFSDAGESLGKVVNKTKDAFMEKSFMTMAGAVQSSDTSAFSANASSKNDASTANLDTVEKLIDEDPELKSTVNEIISQSGSAETRETVHV